MSYVGRIFLLRKKTGLSALTKTLRVFIPLLSLALLSHGIPAMAEPGFFASQKTQETIYAGILPAPRSSAPRNSAGSQNAPRFGSACLLFCAF
jgi:hypothetical protein